MDGETHISAWQYHDILKYFELKFNYMEVFSENLTASQNLLKFMQIKSNYICYCSKKK
jgi:hypothetical protein